MSVNLHYDKATDAAYLRFSAEVVVESEEVAPGVVLDYDADGKMVGMEVLDARSHLPPDALVAAEIAPMPPKWCASACLAAALAMAACSPAKAPDSGAASSQGPDLSFYLQPAFRAAFGADAPAAHDVDRPGGKAVMQVSPHLLADLGGGRMALISTARRRAASDCQDCGGAVAVHYLRQVNGEFHVEGQSGSTSALA